MTNRERLISLLARLAYREGNFTLSSGRASSVYLDAKLLTYHPEGVELVGNQVFNAIEKASVQAVGGLTMGADAIVISTVWASQLAGSPIPGFVVRKEPKPHGLEKWIEGISPVGMRVAIVDDVITSGASVLKAVRAARDSGAEVAIVVGLIDRQEGGEAAIREAGVGFHALCSLAEVRAAARDLSSVPA